MIMIPILTRFLALDVEKKLKKLDWGSNDSVDPREHLNIVFIGHVGTHFTRLASNGICMD